MDKNKYFEGPELGKLGQFYYSKCEASKNLMTKLR